MKRIILKLLLHAADFVIFIVVLSVLGVLAIKRAIKKLNRAFKEKRKSAINSFEYSHNDRF